LASSAPTERAPLKNQQALVQQAFALSVVSLLTQSPLEHNKHTRHGCVVTATESTVSDDIPNINSNLP
jgi:hypothetical protein